MNILDWIVVASLTVGAVRGLRRGLVRSVLGLAGLILGLVVASRFYRPLTEYLELHYGAVTRMASGIAAHLPLPSTVAATPASEGGALVEAVQGMGLPEFVTGYLVAGAEQLANLPDAATVGEALATLLASSVVGVLSFVALFVATQVLTALLAWVISGVISVTPLVVVDRLAGMALGAVYVGVVVTLVIGGLALLAGMPAFSFMTQVLAASKTAPFFLDLFELLLPRIPDWLSLG